MKIKNQFPRLGIGILILRNKKILMLKRQGSHGAGQWNLPGGHLEFGETTQQCVRREIFEETGLKVKTAKVICVNEELNFIETDGKHYITIGCLAKVEKGEPILKEPEKCEKLDWFSLNDLPASLFLPSQNILDCYRKKVVSLVQ
ncbi:hypothetical protein A2160_00985 [Candidatus Beckwithbacteria bacterium RBG_13_42_9]|uniref:Nudix hydrolase domain-containing protein n=1 Tax=Candidatus Beckwithbacteria bacterium RBG_13_42_9 TaxID=1797457 RepID=A0A1F5E3G7_9BACT|nr:MAG: hypothetical protein A2160_00985 [Candidatus Beckwithbacteria bacterium RBG_13_42_9]